MEETIDLKEYFAIVKKRFWIIALITAVSIVISGAISFFVLSPVYQASSTLIVNTTTLSTGEQNTTIITSDQIGVAQKLAVAYGEIIKSRTVTQPIVKNLKLNMSAEQVASMISVAPVNDTQILRISVTDTNPERARDIANEIPIVFEKEAKRIVKANSVEVIDEALTPKAPIKPNKMMNVAIAAVLGVMIGLFVIFIIEYLDNKMKTPQDIEKHLGLPILGVIPNENVDK